MNTTRLGGHYLQKYDAELEDVRSRVLAMGGLVEKQMTDALAALVSADTKLAATVIETDLQVNGFEVSIDEECSQIFARHQPAASDLRFLIAVIKTITDLERMGDKAEKIAEMAIALAEQDRPRSNYAEVQSLGNRVLHMVHGALDAFARMDAEAAVNAAREDEAVDNEYESIMRQQMTFMMEDPRNIGRIMNVIWTLRAIERVGDHARNVCEYVIYLVRGKDVRHVSMEEMERAAQGLKG